MQFVPFRIILKGGKELPFKVRVATDDVDVAAHQASKRLGIANVSHAIRA